MGVCDLTIPTAKVPTTLAAPFIVPYSPRPDPCPATLYVKDPLSPFAAPPTAKPYFIKQSINFDTSFD
jgi:hypothetical protein